MNQNIENGKVSREKQIDSPCLYEFLNERLVRLRVKVNSMEDAIREAGNLLVDEKIVEPRYVEAMIRVAKQLGSYIVVAPGVAIPHASSADGVKRLGIALITLDPPVVFGNKENDPVYVCLAFASPSNTQHLKLLSEIANFMEDPKNIDKLKKASSKEEVLEIIKNYQRRK